MRALIAAVMPAAGDRIDRFEPYLEAACTRFGITSDLALANQGRGGLWAGMAIVSAASSVVGWFSHNFLNR